MRHVLACVAGFEPAFPKSRCPTFRRSAQLRAKQGSSLHFRRAGVLPLDETHNLERKRGFEPMGSYPIPSVKTGLAFQWPLSTTA